jgi:hypothetical protein
MSQYQREIDAVARKLAPEVGANDADAIESAVWDHADAWEHLVDQASEERFVRDVTKAIAAIREKEGSEITKAFADLGFSVQPTGGGCVAYEATSPDGGQVLVTDDDCHLPGTWDEPAVMASFGSDGSPMGDDVHFDSVGQLIESLRKGSRTSTPKAGDAADIELVNQHRRQLGMGPIDPGMGWTAKEIRDMARNIRETGRMANPKLLPLIEIPRR